MIILNNYSKIGTYIILDANGYSIVGEDKVPFVRQGEGGFGENGELLGIYVENNKLFFLYANKRYEVDPNEILCTNKKLDTGMRDFEVTINDKKVCDILYKPYISPLALPFGDDEDEFDFLLYLSKLLHDKYSISKFITGMNNLGKS